MCCFTGPVDNVASTNIFARDAGNGRQFLAYSMEYQAREDLAMVLPLPVPPRSREGDVQFISLDGYPDFFEDLKSGFPAPRMRNTRSFDEDTRSADLPLEVVRVGNFDASFVPTVADFRRLDPRFQMPPGVWQQLPAYHDYGFAVFKLRRGGGQAHPMALSFPRRDPARLFFPTVHVHDGAVHAEAHFDHSLYMQSPGRAPGGASWLESVGPARDFVRVERTRGLVSAALPCYRRDLNGTFRNTDVVV